MTRNYRQEYDRYQGTAKQKKRRAMRNKARRQAIRKGQVQKGDGKDVHHKDGNPMNNKAGNTYVRSASSNRSFPRNKKAQKR
jgi:predicted N-acyltransferase|tara:strand:- start:816 stop:1061 length:246 start_codon:yes stop_codon:yes gene_type:complete